MWQTYIRCLFHCHVNYLTQGCGWLGTWLWLKYGFFISCPYSCKKSIIHLLLLAHSWNDHTHVIMSIWSVRCMAWPAYLKSFRVFLLLRQSQRLFQYWIRMEVEESILVTSVKVFGTFRVSGSDVNLHSGNDI